MLPRLKEGLSALGLALSDTQQTQLLDYLALIAKWNKVYNLTAIRDEPQMLTHHLLDSLAVVGPLQTHLKQAAMPNPRVLDVGAGAGLPGVVIAICCPNIAVYCVDAVGKKASFIQQAAATLGLSNLVGVHSRVEALSAAVVAKGFDVVTSRAFASLDDFTRLTIGHIRQNTGVWMAMKSRAGLDEVAALPNHAQVFHVEQLEVPFLNEERRLIWLRLH